MENLKLGSLIDGVAERDATHIAVAPVIAGEDLKPGRRVGFTGTDQMTVGLVNIADTIGIIDPFLKKTVLRGQRCWLFLYPQTITSLKHNWTHPAFKVARVSLTESEMWVSSFAQEKGMAYDTLMMGAKNYLKSGELLCFGSLLDGESLPDNFWDHYEEITGSVVPSESRGSFFSCSC